MNDEFSSQIASVQNEIQKARAELRVNLVRLKGRVERVRQWRYWVRRKPVLAVACAFALGAFLGRAVGRRNRYD